MLLGLTEQNPAGRELSLLRNSGDLRLWHRARSCRPTFIFWRRSGPPAENRGLAV